MVIKPQWEPYEEKDGDIVLELDPGLAFGTGSHPTTGGALKLLEQETAQGMKVMDFGCGTGILAVAAGLLGANEVYCRGCRSRGHPSNGEKYPHQRTDDNSGSLRKRLIERKCNIFKEF